MGIVKIILIYIGMNFGVRLIIDFVLFLLIQIIYFLVEPVNNKLKKCIQYIIEHKIDAELEGSDVNRKLNIINIFNLLIKGTKYFITEKYDRPNELKDTLIIKFKCNIDKFIILYAKKYELVFNDEVPVNGEKLKYCIESVFKICIFNIFVLGISYYYFIDEKEIMIILGYIKSIEYIKFLNYIIFILSLPIIKTVYSYIHLKLLFKNQYNELKNKYIDLIKCIEENIEKLSIYKIEAEVEYISDEITNNIGFKLKDGNLETQDRTMRYLLYDFEKKRLQLYGIGEKINKINGFIKNEFINKNRNGYRFEQWILKEPYCFKSNEKHILDYKLYRGYNELSEYFEKNHNQIYKHKFTDVRVVQEDRIILLDSYIKRCEEWLKNYRSEFTEYILNILILDYEVKKHLIYMNRILFSTKFTDVLRNVISMSIMEYLRIIKKILY